MMPFFSKEEIADMKAGLIISKDFREKTNNSLILIAHRGMGPTSLLGPTFEKSFIAENTIPSFKYAIIAGADGFELDIFLSKDAEIMVIHDDELWKNVYGCIRDGSELPHFETKDSFLVSKKTVDDLKKFNMGPQSEKIPSLSEVFELVEEANQIRSSLGFPPLIINIELKDSVGIDTIFRKIHNYVLEHPGSGIDFITLYFCSFHHEALIKLKNIAKQHGVNQIKVAPGLKTKTLFGDENVDEKFRVKPGTSYSLEGLRYIKNLVEEHQLDAYDCVLWDLGQDLITLAQQANKDLFVSTSDFRDYDSYAAVFNYLYVTSKKIPLFFKCDEINKAFTAFMRIAAIHTAVEADRLNLATQSFNTSLTYIYDNKPELPFSKARLNRKNSSDSGSEIKKNKD